MHKIAQFRSEQMGEFVECEPTKAYPSLKSTKEIHHVDSEVLDIEAVLFGGKGAIN